MRRVDENLLVGLHGQLDVLQKHGRLVARVLVEPDLADAQHARPVEKLRDHRDHFARQRDVLRLLGVDAQPGEMLNAVPAGPLRLERRELLEVVAKPVDAAAVVAGPKRRLAHRHAAHLGERLVVVRRPRDHVDVGVDVVHGRMTNVE